MRLIPETNGINKPEVLANKLINYPGLVIDDAGEMVGTSVDFASSTLRNAGAVVVNTAASGKQLAYNFINAIRSQMSTRR